MQNEKPSIKVPLYRTEGNPGLQVGRCICVTERLFGDEDNALGLGKRCESCGMFFFDYSTLGDKTFVSWAYSTPERRKE